MLMFSPHKAAAPVLPFFSVKGSKTSSRKRHILMRIRHWLLLHLLFPPKVTKRCLRMPHLDKCCHVFCEWPLNGAVLPKKLSLDIFLLTSANQNMRTAKGGDVKLQVHSLPWDFTGLTTRERFWNVFLQVFS